MMKAVYDMARKGARDEIQTQCVMVACSPEVDDENLPLESEPGMDVASAPSVRKVRFGDGIPSERLPG